jgi:uncharacterized protein (DUF2141 family)
MSAQRPVETDLVGSAALAIKTLAEQTDAALAGTAVSVVSDTRTTTNSNGDVAIVFPGLGTVAGVIVTNIYLGGLGDNAKLQVPIWTRVSGAPAGQAYVKAVSSLTGATFTNFAVRFNAIGWGPA